MKFKHKGLELLSDLDDARLLPPNLVPKIRRVLSDLEFAHAPGDMAGPGRRLHPLKGQRRGQWSVRVSSNWRLVFRFDNGEAVDIDLVDYH